jgi:hypothetical protein
VARQRRLWFEDSQPITEAKQSRQQHGPLPCRYRAHRFQTGICASIARRPETLRYRAGQRGSMGGFTRRRARVFPQPQGDARVGSRTKPTFSAALLARTSPNASVCQRAVRKYDQQMCVVTSDMTAFGSRFLSVEVSFGSGVPDRNVLMRPHSGGAAMKG